MGEGAAGPVDIAGGVRAAMAHGIRHAPQQGWVDRLADDAEYSAHAWTSKPPCTAEPEASAGGRASAEGRPRWRVGLKHFACSQWPPRTGRRSGGRRRR